MDKRKGLGGEGRERKGWDEKGRIHSVLVSLAECSSEGLIVCTAPILGHGVKQEE